MSLHAKGLPILGPVEGFWPVEGFPGEAAEQVWIPKGLQDYEALCLAQIIKDSGYEPTHVVSIARGGLATAQAILYANEVKPTLGYQTYGYDNKGNPLPEPEITARPDFTGLRKAERRSPLRLLITDELLDEGKTIRAVKNDIIQQLNPEEVLTAVIYEKNREHVMGVDFSVRTVRNLWLDHETQASTARRNARLEQLHPHIDQIADAMGKLAVLPADINLLHDMLGMSAAAHTITQSRSF